MPKHRSSPQARPARWLPAVVYGVLAAGLSILPDAVRGHAIVVQAQPAMNALVQPGTLEIWLEFNSRRNGSGPLLVLIGLLLIGYREA